MKKQIRNMNDLQKALMPTMEKMVDKLADRVYETLNYFIHEYYESYSPVYYRRLQDFLYSAVKVEPKIQGNKVVASVYIDTDSMNSYYNATGHQVTSWANQGLHGGMYTGSNTPRVWDDTLDETINNGELLNLAIQYLKSKGISVVRK